MKLLNSTPITEGITFSAGYTKGCSVTIVHAKPTILPNEKLHYHSKDSEYFYVLHGGLKVEVDAKAVDVKEKMCLETQPNERHKIISLKRNTEYIVVRTNLLPGKKVLLE